MGLNGVVADLLSMLSITELGFQSAIIYRLYRPIAEKDITTINHIMSFLKKIYSRIGIVILLIGLLLIPFLSFIINDDSLSMNTVYCVYVILLLSSVVTYFISYKRALLYANQKQIISVMTDTWVNIGISIGKIVCIIILRNYYIFILLTLVQSILSNSIINIYCKKLYPDINVKEKPDFSLKRGLFQDTKNIFAGKIAAYVYSSTDNLVISVIINTSMVGIVGNYTSLMNALTGLILASMSPFQPMIGDYLVTENREKSKLLFERYTFLRYALTLIVLTPTTVVVNRFIELLYGVQYILPRVMPILIIINLYISVVHGPVGEYISASGLFKQEKKVLILGAVANITVSVIGAYIYGVPGVLFGTVISQMIMWIGKSMIAFDRCLKYKHYEIVQYWKRQLLYAAVFAVACLSSDFAINILNINGSVIGFIASGSLCVIIASFLLVLVFHKNDSFRYFYIVIQPMIKLHGIQSRNL